MPRLLFSNPISQSLSDFRLKLIKLVIINLAKRPIDRREFIWTPGDRESNGPFKRYKQSRIYRDTCRGMGGGQRGRRG